MSDQNTNTASKTVVADPKKNLPAEAKQLIASVANDIFIPHYSNVLYPTDDVLVQKGGGKGVKIFREVERDARARAVLSKRKRRLLSRTWQVSAASDDALDQAAAELIERHVRNMDFDGLCRDLLDAVLMGFSIVELIWDRDGTEIIVKSHHKHDQRRFRFDRDWQLRLLTREHMIEGLALPDRKFIVQRFEPDGNDPYGRGLGSVLFWPVLFKREGVTFWLKALERFAVPIPVGKYPAGTLPAQQQILLDALSGSISDGALVVPIGTEITFATAAISGTVTHEDWCRYWDDQIAEAVVGQTLTTGVKGGGSRAAAETHKDIEDEIVDSDENDLAAVLQATLCQWIIDYNLPGAKPPRITRPRPRNEREHEEVLQRRAERQARDLDNLFNLVSRGVEPENIDDTISEVMGQPYKIKGKLIAQSLPVQAGQPLPVTEFASFEELSSPLSVVNAAVSPHLDSWINQIASEIGTAAAAGEPLSSLSNRLLQLYPELSLDGMGEVLADAFAVADATGRADVIDETGSG